MTSPKLSRPLQWYSIGVQLCGQYGGFGAVKGATHSTSKRLPAGQTGETREPTANNRKPREAQSIAIARVTPEIIDF